MRGQTLQNRLYQLRFYFTKSEIGIKIRSSSWFYCLLLFQVIVVFTSCNSLYERPPNIIIIFTDDQGYADVGKYGAKGFQTPNLDRMAEEGIRFTDFHVSQAVCSASRASLLTGCYSERVSIQGALHSRTRIGLNPDEETIADVLKKKGYATGIFGKWHLGHHEKFLPLQQGFDEFFGLPYSNDMWPVGFDGKPLDGNGSLKSYYPQLELIEGNEKIEEVRTLEDQSRLTTRYTERAVNFIIKNKDKPFFLYLPHSMPHVPLAVSDKFKGKSEQGLYGDVIMEIDWSVGQILKALKSNGLDENTLVIFMSDNGPWLNFGNHAGSAFPLREGKGTMWEGGARVPCIMRWIGTIHPGTVTDKLAATIDILPTVASITSAPLPKNKIDGLDIQSILYGSDETTPRNEYYYYYGAELIAVRAGQWKLCFPHSYRSYEGMEPGQDGFPGKYGRGTSGLALYDLKNDISETTNVVNQYPKIVNKLKVLGEKARAELGDLLSERKGSGVRPPGRLTPAKTHKVTHKAIGKKVALATTFHRKYTGGGTHALTNGITGSEDYTDGNWQGFEGNDFEATVDLGQLIDLKEIKASFLQDQVAWIFYPVSVEILTSSAGDEYNIIKSFIHKTKQNLTQEIKFFTTSLPDEKIRFIKIRAKSQGECPSWHPGNGGPAWIFIDEIVVQ